jgi:hypothetical protein
MMMVLHDQDVIRHSTAAARQYVLSTRDRLRAEVERDGELARHRRSYKRLQESITAEQLVHTWPRADLEAALVD